VNSKARNSKQLGAIIKMLRKQRKLTQAQLGKNAGVKQGQISTIEKGAEGVRLSTLFKVLSALDCEINVRPRTEPKKALEDLFNG